ncbi:MAG TPA: response regulator [Pyrinomonadaceae bacterium]|jgi:CheY-like chemotaxis protein|nr:response regulator [Pyrinomonadaceae bacterium]
MASTGNLQVPATASGAPAFPCLKRTILVAEDSSDSREMLQVLLEMKGYAVVSAADGHRAVEVALQKVPDLILIDLQLPGLDGLSATKELRLHPELRAVPIIVISGHDPSKYRTEALRAGCDDYLLKPIDFDRLDQILHERIPAAVRARSA